MRKTVTDMRGFMKKKLNGQISKKLYNKDKNIHQQQQKSSHFSCADGGSSSLFPCMANPGTFLPIYKWKCSGHKSALLGF